MYQYYSFIIISVLDTYTEIIPTIPYMHNINQVIRLYTYRARLNLIYLCARNSHDQFNTGIKCSYVHRIKLQTTFGALSWFPEI